MKRNAIALILSPFKNRLMPQSDLKSSIESFAVNLLSLTEDLPHFRFNVALPAYILEQVNTMLLSKFRELQSRGVIEWVLTGYTEPFLSLSPLNLTHHNIRYGMEVFSDLTGEIPTGFYPPCSNWEPFLIDMLSTAGLQYALLSRTLFPQQTRNSCGYWIAEHTGSSLALVATDQITPLTAPAHFIDWLQKLFSQDKNEFPQEKLTAVQYLIPLNQKGGSDPFRWLRYAAEELEKYLLTFQSVRIGEYLRSVPPLGLQYIPSSLLTENECTDQHFLNYLYSFDQVGILQRKILDANRKVHDCTDTKLSQSLKRELCFVQDINRLLPAKDYGFQDITDRLWTFSKLINIEKSLYHKRNISGGQIRITDFMKNGVKSIILANKGLKAYIDNTNGGHIFEFDYRERELNLCASYNSQQHQPPNIIVAGKSKTWFMDRLLPTDCKSTDLLNGTSGNPGNFLTGPFEYKVNKTTTGVKIDLVRRDSLIRADRQYPLSLEKVFGLEKDNAVFSFVYQISNLSLIAFDFKFSTQLDFSFPGLSSGDVRIFQGTQSFSKPGWEFFQFQSVTRWCIEDKAGGIRLLFRTQKPFDIWCLPASTPDCTNDPSQGFSMILSSNVKLDPSSSWKNMGKISFRKMRKKNGDSYAI